MTYFLEQLLNGISIGAIYGLVALGFVIIFKASHVLSFAHGSLLFLGAFCVWYAVSPEKWGLNFWFAALIGIALTALTALILERAFIAPLRGAPIISLATITLGMDVVFATLLINRIGTDLPKSLDHPWGGRTFSFGDISITQNRFYAIIAAAILIGAFFAAFKYSNWGVAMRASAEDGETAALMGIRQGRVSMGAWVVAGVLAAVAGIFLVGPPSGGLDPTIRFLALAAFPAAIIGGLDSTGGALVGGLIVGVAEALSAGYAEDLSFLGDTFYLIAPYVVMIIVLLVRPSGLFGTRELTRV
jgi:branched-chain amino acid transport system permease protein